MVLFSPRALIAAVLGSHVIRSLWVTTSPGIEQVESDLLAFRQELARGQRLLSHMTCAPEVCSRESEVQRLLLKISGCTELVLLAVLVWSFWCRRRAKASGDLPPVLRLTERTEEVSDKSTSQDSFPKPQQPTTFAVPRGPTTPSSLRLAQTPSKHGSGKDTRC